MQQQRADLIASLKPLLSANYGNKFDDLMEHIESHWSSIAPFIHSVHTMCASVSPTLAACKPRVIIAAFVVAHWPASLHILPYEQVCVTAIAVWTGFLGFLFDCSTTPSVNEARAYQTAVVAFECEFGRWRAADESKRVLKLQASLTMMQTALPLSTGDQRLLLLTQIDECKQQLECHTDDGLPNFNALCLD